MSGFLNKYLPVEFRIFFRGFFIVVFILLLFPLGSWLTWRLIPAAPLEVMVIDKTVPNLNQQEHQSIHWLLNHFRFTKGDGSLYNEFQDYLGFFPGKKKEDYHINDLSGKSESEIQNKLDSTQLVYFADTYGVYENDLLEQPKQTYSKKIYGGLDSHDMDFLNRAYKSEIDIIMNSIP
jgi:hypothetical protein